MYEKYVLPRARMNIIVNVMYKKYALPRARYHCKCNVLKVCIT